MENSAGSVLFLQHQHRPMLDDAAAQQPPTPLAEIRLDACAASLEQQEPMKQTHKKSQPVSFLGLFR